MVHLVLDRHRLEPDRFDDPSARRRGRERRRAPTGRAGRWRCSPVRSCTPRGPICLPPIARISGLTRTRSPSFCSWLPRRCAETSTITMRRGIPTCGAAIPTPPGEQRIVSRRSSMNAATSAVTPSTGAALSLRTGSGKMRMGRTAMEDPTITPAIRSGARRWRRRAPSGSCRNRARVPSCRRLRGCPPRGPSCRRGGPWRRPPGC